MCSNVKPGLNTLTIVHEIGHSVQYVKGDDGVSKPYKMNELRKVFDEEVAACRQKYPKQAEIYAMTDPCEMFAEIYILLNSNYSETFSAYFDSKLSKHNFWDDGFDWKVNQLKILKDNFPKCIETVKKHIAEIRALDESKRNNKVETYNVMYDSQGRLVAENAGNHSSYYTYDPIFPDILRTSKYLSPVTNPIEIQYFHERMIRTESCLYNGTLEK